MSTSSIIPISKLSEDAREFLFVCAFWAVAADEELKPGEQNWLAEQFGERDSTELLQRCAELSGGDFFSALDELTGLLSDGEKMVIYPWLVKWMWSCIESDGEVGKEEQGVLNELVERINLNAELARLMPDSDTGVEDAPEAVAGAAASASEEFEVVTLAGHGGSINDVSCSSDGKIAVTASEDGTAKLWDIRKGTEVSSLEGHECGVTGIAMSPDDTKIYSGDRRGTVVCWDPGSSTVVGSITLNKQGGITAVDASPDGSQVCVTTEVGKMNILDTDDLSEIKTLDSGKGGIIHSGRYSPDGKLLASAGDDRIVRIWDVARDRIIRELKDHDDGVLDICFTPDGKTLVSVGRDNAVMIWNAQTGGRIRTCLGHTFTAQGVSASPDGKVVMTTSADHTVRFWEISTGKELFKHEQYTCGFSRCMFTPSGKTALICGGDSLLYVLKGL